MENREIRNRVLRKSLTDPPAAVTGVLGAAALLVGAVMVNPALAAMGAVALGVGVAIGAANLLFGAKRLRQEVFREKQMEEARARNRQLDRLYRRLRMDDDSSSQRSLRRLRELYERFHGNTRWTTELDRYTAVEIANSVEKLFAACVDALERSLELWETACRMTSPDARHEVLARRQQMLDEVRQSIDQFAQTVDEVHAMGVRTVVAEDVSQFRDELQQNLDVARKVEERMRDLEAELQGPLRQRE